MMHESERRGLLLLNGKPMPDDALARLLGLDAVLLKQILTTLDNHGVTSRDPETGALMSRRMVKDENLRKIRAQAGKQGGNPVLLKQNPTTQLKQIPTPSSSSSPSGLEEVEEGKPLLDSEQQHAEPFWSKQTGWCGISQACRKRWGIAYPACNIDRQLAQMDEWLRANPAESHKSAWSRFITNWLKREQDKGGDTRSDRKGFIAAPAPKPAPPRRESDPNAGQTMRCEKLF